MITSSAKIRKFNRGLNPRRILRDEKGVKLCWNKRGGAVNLEA